jgi:hypothetical protein
MNEPRYASYDGYPVRLTDGEAWQCIDGEWVRINAVEAACSAALVSADEFAKHYPGLPPLPPRAFS